MSRNETGRVVIEYNSRYYFHPGYYILELVEESGLSQHDFAKKLGTTPKTLSKLIHAKQDLTTEMAARLAMMQGTSARYWLNLQAIYDEALAGLLTEEEIAKEKAIYKFIPYQYFRKNCGAPDLPRKIGEQIQWLCGFLKLSSLGLLRQPDLALKFRSSKNELKENNLINCNILLQIALNYYLMEGPDYQECRLSETVETILRLTEDPGIDLEKICSILSNCGISLAVLPHIGGSGINGMVKKVGNRLLVVIDDSRHYEDTFWFTLFHELGHVANKDYGISGEENDVCEEQANEYARNQLIPADAYMEFVSGNRFDQENIQRFSISIQRDPSIVLGRLRSDGYVPYTNQELDRAFRHRFDAPPIVVGNR